MESKFKKGDSVVFVKDVHWREDGFEPMIVIDFTETGGVVVEVDDWYSKKSKEIHPAHTLMLESDADQKLSELDLEWQRLSPIISEQMNKVSAAFEEALKLSKDNGFKLKDFGVGSHIRSMIRQGGWSSSYFSC